MPRIKIKKFRNTYIIIFGVTEKSGVQYNIRLLAHIAYEFTAAINMPVLSSFFSFDTHKRHLSHA